MQKVKLVFTPLGQLVDCLPPSSAYDDGDSLEVVPASVSDGLANALIKQFDRELSERRFEIAQRLADKYLTDHTCSATDEKTITINGRVIIPTECDGANYGTFECQFAHDSQQVLHCAIMVGGRMEAQFFPPSE